MFRKVMALTCCFMGLMIPAAYGETWIVKRDGSGDFTQISEALAHPSVQAGDTLLIGAGPFDSFSLEKGVHLRALGASFEVRDHIDIRNIAQARQASVTGAEVWGNPAYVDIVDCSGAVNLEAIELGRNGPIPPGLLIYNSSNVSVSGFSVDLSRDTTFEERGVVRVILSDVRMDDVSILAGRSTNATDRGMNGIDVINGRLILAGRVDVVGGSGPHGTEFQPNGGRGGDGILVDASELILLGTFATNNDRVVGGTGGFGDTDEFGGCLGSDGDGGAGIRVLEGSAIVSRVHLQGGRPPLFGCGGGTTGPPFEGNVTRLDLYPHLAMAPDLDPGSNLILSIDSEPKPGTVALLLGENTGFVTDNGIFGPPFSVLPGGFYFAIPLGRTDPRGQVSLQGHVPPDPELVGFTLNLQGLVFADDGTTLLSNAITRVLGE